MRELVELITIRVERMKLECSVAMEYWIASIKKINNLDKPNIRSNTREATKCISDILSSDLNTTVISNCTSIKTKRKIY